MAETTMTAEDISAFMMQPLPSNYESEWALLGAILLDNELFSDAAELLTASDFYSPFHRCVFEGMLECYVNREPIDPITVHKHMKSKVGIETWGVHELSNLTLGIPHATNVDVYAKAVKDAANLRSLIRTCNSIVNAAMTATEFDVIRAQAESAIYSVCEAGDAGLGDTIPINETLTEVFAKTVDMYQRGVSVVGVTTGLRDLDALLNGWHKGNLIVVAGRPSMGKSALAAGFAVAAAKANSVVAYFTLEDTRESTASRILAGDARIDLRRWRQARPYSGEITRADESVKSSVSWPLYIFDKPGINAMDIRSRCRRIVSRHGRLDLIVVDYLQMMSAVEKTNGRVDEVSKISAALKNVARELDVPLIALSQLSRKPEDRNPPIPQMSDLRDSGTIEQDADVVMFVYRDEYYNPTESNKGLAELIVAKQRNGPTGTVETVFLKESTRFMDKFREPVSGLEYHQ